MRIKRVIPILVSVLMILCSTVCYAEPNPKLSEQEKQIYQQIQEQQIQNQKAIEDILLTQNSDIALFANSVLNPMNLADIDPSTNPASNNWLTQEVAMQVGKADVTQLTQADFNRITGNIWFNSQNVNEIPKEIGNLYYLRGLNIANNQINKIPDTIGNLSNLVYLNLLNNQISEIPDSICTLPNLSDLYLSGNQIQKIPDNIGNLSNLMRLNLSDNQISTIPNGIGSLSNLIRSDTHTRDFSRELVSQIVSA